MMLHILEIIKNKLAAVLRLHRSPDTVKSTPALGFDDGVLKQRSLKIRQLGDDIETWHSRAHDALNQSNKELAIETLSRKWLYQIELAAFTNTDAPARPQTIRELGHKSFVESEHLFFKPPDEPEQGTMVTRKIRD